MRGADHRCRLTLDPDTEEIVRQRMAARGVSFKRALNDAIRVALEHRAEIITFDRDFARFPGVRCSEPS